MPTSVSDKTEDDTKHSDPNKATYNNNIHNIHTTYNNIHTLHKDPNRATTNNPYPPSGCLDDIRLEGRQLPLPPAMNGTQWGQATVHRNLKMDCPSNEPCANVICPTPFSCIDMWKKYDCA